MLSLRSKGKLEVLKFVAWRLQVGSSCESEEKEVKEQLYFVRVTNDPLLGKSTD